MNRGKLKFSRAAKLFVVLIATIIGFVLTAIVAGQLLVVPWGKGNTVELKKPKIIVKKANRTLELFDAAQLIKTYKIALGSSPLGDKQTEGDGKTPEGKFYLFTKNAESKFYLSLGVSYPNKEDAERGLRNGIISQDEYDQIVEAIESNSTPPQKTKLGGEIYIHGYGNLTDWTEGCVAMTNSDMKELFDSVPVGTKVIIEP